jgi:hypothetical protein
MDILQPKSHTYTVGDFSRLAQHLELYNRKCLQPSLRFAMSYLVLGRQKKEFMRSINRYMKYAGAVIDIMNSHNIKDPDFPLLITFNYELQFLGCAKGHQPKKA